MVAKAIRQALIAPISTEPYGEVSGAEVMQLAEDRGLATEEYDIYGQVIHNAALSDIVVSAIRKPKDEPWFIPPPLPNWTSDCLMSPCMSNLRRIVLVSNWTDARHYSECRNWFTMGEIAHYKLPMQLVILVIGQERKARRLSPWTQGFLHPANKTLRFRKKSRSTTEIFNDAWQKIAREDHAEISRETWLNAMLKDDVLPEVCFKVDVPVPDAKQCERIRDMARLKMERLQKMTEKPEANLSSCDWPTPCVFRKLCHTIPERNPSERNGFVPIVSIQNYSLASRTA